MLISEGDVVTIEIRVVKVERKPEPAPPKSRAKRGAVRQYFIGNNRATHRDMIHHGFKGVGSSRWVSVKELEKFTGLDHPSCGDTAWNEAQRGTIRKDLQRKGYYGILEGYQHIYSWEKEYKPVSRPLKRDGKTEITSLKPLGE